VPSMLGRRRPAHRRAVGRKADAARRAVRRMADDALIVDGGIALDSGAVVDDEKHASDELPPPLEDGGARLDVPVGVDLDGPVEDVVPATAHSISKIVGYRLGRYVDESGELVLDFVADQFMVRFEGCGQEDDEWIFRRDIDAPDLLSSYEATRKAHISREHKRFPGRVLDFGYEGVDPHFIAQTAGDGLAGVSDDDGVQDDEGAGVQDGEGAGAGSDDDVPLTSDDGGTSTVPTGVIAALMSKMRSLPVDSWRNGADVDVLSQVEPCVPVFDVELQAYKDRLVGKLSGAVGQRVAIARYGKLKRAVKRFRITCAVAAKMVVLDDPLNYKEVMASVNAPAWQQAMNDELAVMDKFGVYELVPRPKGCNVVSCRWVFAKKLDVHGRLDRLKARLCARGFSQVAGEDYTDTFAPTGRIRVLRAMMAEASGRGDVFTRQWDVTSAFLHALPDEEIFMEAPPGTLPKDDDRVWRLRRVIYGLRQAGHLFHQLVDETLVGAGAVRSDADACFYILRRGDEWVKILCYVDDFAVTSNSPGLYGEIWETMQSIFDIKDLGVLRLFLGIHITYDVDGCISVDQQHYVKIVLGRLGMSGTPGVGPKSPMASGTKAKLSPGDAEPCGTDVPYKTAVGALFWIARGTRFDIAYAVSQAARFMEAPTVRHWKAVVRIFRYLAGTIGQKLRMGPRGGVNDLLLRSYTDSDWAGDIETRKSRTGWLVGIGGACVAWRSSLQTGYSQSATEAEYVALADAAKEVLWWHKLYRDMGWYCAQPTPIMVDNRGAMLLTTGEGNFNRSKHIALRYHSLRQWVAEVLIRVFPIAGLNNCADVLTKNTAAGLFGKLVGQVFDACL